MPSNSLTELRRGRDNFLASPL